MRQRACICTNHVRHLMKSHIHCQCSVSKRLHARRKCITTHVRRPMHIGSDAWKAGDSAELAVCTRQLHGRIMLLTLYYRPPPPPTRHHRQRAVMTGLSRHCRAILTCRRLAVCRRSTNSQLCKNNGHNLATVSITTVHRQYVNNSIIHDRFSPHITVT